MGNHQELDNGTKQRILSATHDLVLDLGIHGVSIDAIAANSKCSKQSIYFHFADKSDVLNQVLSLLWRNFHEVTFAVDTNCDDLHGELTNSAEQYLEHLLSTLSLRTISVGLEAARRTDVAATEVRGLVPKHLHASICTLIDRHIKIAGLQHNLSATDLADSFMGLLVGGVLWRALLEPNRTISSLDRQAHVSNAVSFVCGTLAHSG